MKTRKICAPSVFYNPNRIKGTCTLKTGAAAAPAHMPSIPKEWKQNPEEWLTNEDIEKFTDRLSRAFSDVDVLPFSMIDFHQKDENTGRCLARDKCEYNIADAYARGKRQILFALNTDKTGGSGIHWVACYVSLEEKDARFIYFDSLGKPPPPSVSFLFNQWKRQLSSSSSGAPKLRFCGLLNRHQYQFNNCGMYVLFFFAIMTLPLGRPSYFPIPIPSQKRQRRESVHWASPHFSFKSLPEKITYFRSHFFSDNLIQEYRHIFFEDKQP